jgi:hypothetical protein
LSQKKPPWQWAYCVISSNITIFVCFRSPVRPRRKIRALRGTINRGIGLLCVACDASHTFFLCATPVTQTPNIITINHVFTISVYRTRFGPVLSALGDRVAWLAWRHFFRNFFSSGKNTRTTSKVLPIDAPYAEVFRMGRVIFSAQYLIDIVVFPIEILSKKNKW